MKPWKNESNYWKFLLLILPILGFTGIWSSNARSQPAAACNNPIANLLEANANAPIASAINIPNGNNRNFHFSGARNLNWRGRNVSISQGTYTLRQSNQTLPAIRINIPAERNYLYVIDTRINFFSWDQAYNMCKLLPQLNSDDNTFWDLPTRTSRGALELMVLAGNNFLRPIGQMQGANGVSVSNLYGLFVREASPEATLGCYEHRQLGYVFSSNFRFATLFGMSDRDFSQAYERNANSNYEVSTQAEEQALVIIARFVLGGRMYADDQLNNAMRNSLQSVFTSRQLREIKDELKRPGPDNTQQGLANIRLYLERNNIDWTAIYSDQIFRQDISTRSGRAATAPDLAQINRPYREGGGLPVYCVVQEAKSSR